MFFPISILVPINSFLPSIKKKTCSKFLNRLSQPKLLPSRWKVLISRGYFPLLFTASHGSLSSFHKHHHRLMVPAVFKFQLWLELEKRSSLMNAKISTLQKLSSHFRMLSSGIRFISKRKIPSVRIFGGKSTFSPQFVVEIGARKMVNLCEEFAVLFLSNEQWRVIFSYRLLLAENFAAF